MGNARKWKFEEGLCRNRSPRSSAALLRCSVGMDLSTSVLPANRSAYSASGSWYTRNSMPEIFGRGPGYASYRSTSIRLPRSQLPFILNGPLPIGRSSNSSIRLPSAAHAADGIGKKMLFATSDRKSANGAERVTVKVSSSTLTRPESLRATGSAGG
jgi:hypothetical protein